MAIQPFLAMTAAEFRENRDISVPMGWMSCLFSPYGAGLSNLPRTLPQGSLLILSDYTPLQGHDPDLIAEQLTACVDSLDCGAVLLDLQRPGVDQAARLAKHLSSALPCPVAVSELYAHDLDCAVFLPSVPPSTPLREYLMPWAEREIWLEMALGGEVITLTEKGAASAPLPHTGNVPKGFVEEALHCHYRIETASDSVKFTLWRTEEDLEALLVEAETLGVKTAVGLYQELHNLTAGEGQ